MLFINMYDIVMNNIFPKSTIKLPKKPIYPYVEDAYYMYTGKRLKGTASAIKINGKNIIIVKDENIKMLEFTEVIYNGDIIKVFIIPHDIDSYEFTFDEAIKIIFEIFKYLCTLYKLESNELKMVFKHAPFVLTLFAYAELSNLPLSSKMKEVRNIINKIVNINYSDDIIEKILSSSIEVLLDKGGIICVFEEYEKE